MARGSRAGRRTAGASDEWVLGRRPAPALVGGARPHRPDVLLRDARDPRLFGMVKTVVRAMQAEGVDPSDRRATDRFLANFNERLRKDPTLLPKADGAAHVQWM